MNARLTAFDDYVRQIIVLRGFIAGRYCLHARQPVVLPNEVIAQTLGRQGGIRGEGVARRVADPAAPDGGRRGRGEDHEFVLAGRQPVPVEDELRGRGGAVDVALDVVGADDAAVDARVDPVRARVAGARAAADAVGIGGAAIVGVTTWVLIQSDNPASPAKP